MAAYNFELSILVHVGTSEPMAGVARATDAALHWSRIRATTSTTTTRSRPACGRAPSAGPST